MFFVFEINYKSILSFVFSEWLKVFDRSISNTIFRSILYFVFNTVPKVSFTTLVTAIGMRGNTPVWITGVLVLFYFIAAGRAALLIFTDTVKYLLMLNV